MYSMNLSNINCTGCSACYSICFKHAINICEDQKGFYKPIINNEKCTNCGLCVRVCPVVENQCEVLFHKPSKKAFAVKSKSRDIQLSCTSGGFFTTLSEAWLKEGGIVYGAAYDEKYKVIHIRVDNIEDVRRLSESKYAQSEIGDSFFLVKKDLKEQYNVLFSGTACQIAGLKSFLGREYDNLFCIDVICHGVPSPKIWKWYIEKFQNNYGKVIHVRHKGKYENGWSWEDQFFEAQFEDGHFFRENIWSNVYMRSFLKDIYLNSSCYKCKFKNLEIRRVSDLTIADYWGCETEERDFFDPNGVNLVIINSYRGLNLLQNHEKLFELKETVLENALKYNIAAVKPYRKPYARAYFFKKWRKVKSLDDFNSIIVKSERILNIENKFIHIYYGIRSRCKKIIVSFIK